MLSFYEAALRSLSVHRVGNKANDEFFVLSDNELELTADQANYFLHYFLSPFAKVNEVFNFYHPNGDLRLNDIHAKADMAFKSYSPDFHWITQRIAEFLYEVTNHPKIKSGELYVAYFENIQFEGELHHAVGIFKSENKETYLKVNPVQEGFNIQFENEAVNISNLDKGCLIINAESEKGFTVLCLDEKSKDSSYWKDEFLRLKVVNDDYQQTSNMISLCKNFITSKLDEDFDISEGAKAALLNKSAQYFKDKESFDVDEYSSEVLNNEQAKESFKQYKSIYDEDFDANIPSCFNISGAAVKKQSKKFKSIIKLDKNFHIYIHGSSDLIERGFDEEKSLNYYKVYYKEESL
ncbi:nucleoid-associated protein [Pedobacter sp.]|uniref:nucleoid-associated protein n=1 Tax=Pedobacter sp. TaxID=1411316 RepID=UPI003D7F788A